MHALKSQYTFILPKTYLIDCYLLLNWCMHDVHVMLPGLNVTVFFTERCCTSYRGYWWWWWWRYRFWRWLRRWFHLFEKIGFLLIFNIVIFTVGCEMWLTLMGFASLNCVMADDEEDMLEHYLAEKSETSSHGSSRKWVESVLWSILYICYNLWKLFSLCLFIFWGEGGVVIFYPVRCWESCIHWKSFKILSSIRYTSQLIDQCFAILWDFLGIKSKLPNEQPWNFHAVCWFCTVGLVLPNLILQK